MLRKEESAQSRECSHRDERRPGERDRLEESKIDEGLLAPSLPVHETGQRCDGKSQGGCDHRRPPAAIGRLDDPVREGTQEDHDQRLTHAIDTPRLWCSGLRDEPEGRTIAVNPTGRLIQKIERHPTVSTRSPPTTGPRAMLIPTTAAQTPTAWARSFGSVKVFVMMDIATGLSIEPPMAWIMRKTISKVRSGAMLHKSEPNRKESRHHEGALAAEPVSGRTREHQQTGQYERVGIDGPLQSRHRSIEAPADRRQGHVHDGHVEPDDEQAHRADQQDPASTGPGQLVRIGSRPTTSIVEP